MTQNSDEPQVPEPTAPTEPAEADEQAAEQADVPSDESTDAPNYTERHPEHFRNPPGHVRELREGVDGDEDGDQDGDGTS